MMARRVLLCLPSKSFTPLPMSLSYCLSLALSASPPPPPAPYEPGGTH